VLLWPTYPRRRVSLTVADPNLAGFASVTCTEGPPVHGADDKVGACARSKTSRYPLQNMALGALFDLCLQLPLLARVAAALHSQNRDAKQNAAFKRVDDAHPGLRASGNSTKRDAYCSRSRWDPGGASGQAACAGCRLTAFEPAVDRRRSGRRSMSILLRGCPAQRVAVCTHTQIQQSSTQPTCKPGDARRPARPPSTAHPHPLARQCGGPPAR